MGFFYVLDSDGFLVRGGYCLDGQESNQALDGETAFAGKPNGNVKRIKPPNIKYGELRRKSYPPLEELADAMVKISSSDDALVIAGNNELQAYVNKCLDVKRRIPKSYSEERPVEYNEYMDGE